MSELEEKQLLEDLGKNRKDRIILYLNDKRVKTLFDQCFDGINQLITGVESRTSFSAGLQALFFNAGANVENKTSFTSKMDISPILQCNLIETYLANKNLIADISKNNLTNESLIKYLGNNKVIEHFEEEVNVNNSGLSEDQAALVQETRNRQEKILQYQNPDDKTYVFVFPGDNPIVSIALVDQEYRDNHSSYGQQPLKGILGRLEQKVKNVIFISPFLIWANPP